MDLTREGLAALVGCSAATIRKLESEERRPSAQIAQIMAQLFEIPADEYGNFLRFARGDWRSAPAARAVDLSWKPVAAQPRLHLPWPTTSFIGRTEELETIGQLLRSSDSRLISLIGPPGIGKTRLSLEAAHRATNDFPEGIFFVALAPLTSPYLILPAILQALGFIGAKGQPEVAHLVDGIGWQHLLLVIDNCEHLIEDVALLFSELLTGCPYLNILATSRESMRVPGEVLFEVPSLTCPGANELITPESALTYPALELFAERVRAIRLDFAIDAVNVNAVAGICTQLDGLPLAIELVAPQLRMMTPQFVLERLGDDFLTPTDDIRAVPLRQKSLRAAVDWSFELLSLMEQRAYAALSVFSGGFTLDAVEAILDQWPLELPVANLLTSFLNKSLIFRTGDLQSETRLGMLVTLRHYAAEWLANNASPTAVRDGHLAYFLSLAEEAEPQLRGPAQIEWFNRLEADLDNFRAALDWSIATQQTEASLRLLGALCVAWNVRGHYREMRSYMERIRALSDAHQYPLLLGWMLSYVGLCDWLQENPVGARALLEESMALVRPLGTAGELCLAEALNWLALVVINNEKNLIGARALVNQALNYSLSHEDDRMVAVSKLHLGIIESRTGHIPEAYSLYESSLQIYREQGDWKFIALVNVHLGLLQLRQGNFEEAKVLLEERLRLDTALQYWDDIADAWLDLAKYNQAIGNTAGLVQCLDEARRVTREHGFNKPTLFEQSYEMQQAISGPTTS